MKDNFFTDILDISSSLLETYRSQLNFSGLFFNPQEVRRKNYYSLVEFNKRYPEIICSGHMSDFQGYIQFKSGIYQRCLLVEGYQFKNTLSRIKSNPKYSEVYGEEIPKNSEHRRIHNLFTNYWNYEKYLKEPNYLAVLNIILAQCWLKKNMPEIFTKDEFNFDTTKFKNLIKMDFLNYFKKITSIYESIENFSKQHRDIILLELSSLMEINDYYQSVIKNLEFTKINDEHRKFISNENIGSIEEFWMQVLNAHFKPHNYIFEEDRPDILKLVDGGDYIINF
jgi:hypothetical protein